MNEVKEFQSSDQDEHTDHPSPVHLQARVRGLTMSSYPVSRKNRSYQDYHRGLYQEIDIGKAEQANAYPNLAYATPERLQLVVTQELIFGSA